MLPLEVNFSALKPFDKINMDPSSPYNILFQNIWTSGHYTEIFGPHATTVEIQGVRDWVPARLVSRVYS